MRLMPETWTRKWSRTRTGQRRRRAAAPSRAAVQQFLDFACADKTDQERLQLLIRAGFLMSDDPSPEALTRVARRWGVVHDDKVRQLVSGNVVFGFNWHAIEGALLECGTPPAHVKIACDLFHDVPRPERQPVASEAALAGLRGADEAPQVTLAPADDEDTGAGDPAATQGPADANEPVAARHADSKPDPAMATTVAELLLMLDQYRVWAGKPSYRTMAASIGNRYGQSTLASITKTAKDATPKLPRLDRIEAFLEGCRADAEDIDRYRAAWRRIALSAPPEQAPTSLPD